MDWLETNSNPEGSLTCEARRPLLTLFVAGDELTREQQREVVEHLAECRECSAEVRRERELLSLLAGHRVEPDAAVLASCRASLEDALDREEERGWLRRKLGILLPSNWLSPEPLWSAALLVLIGFSVGLFGPRFLQRPKAISSPAYNPPSAAVDSSAGTTADLTPAATSSEVSSLDLHNADVASINVFPADAGAPPQVELHMRARQPITVQGTVDDDSVKRVLLYVLRNNDRFDADVRLNAVDLLRARNQDPEVRSALCRSVQTDGNAAVRLKALEALDGAEPQDIIRDTLLGALIDDTNPGVRVEAINSLRGMAEKGQLVADNHMLSVLRDRMQHDPNTYIRLQSAAAMRDLDPGQK
jgi:HEAT repeats/Putative zinc-finger